MTMRLFVETNLELLHDLRTEKKLSISDVAKELGYKTPTGYWLIEAGERKLSVAVLYKLSRLYGCSMEDLLIIVE